MTTAVSKGTLLVARLWNTLRVRQPHLAWFGAVCLAAAVPLVVAQGLDPRTVNGISVWVKPVKFLVSLAVLFWTLAWNFGYLAPAAQRSALGRYIIVVMPWLALAEMVWLIGMSAAGQASHFNLSSPLASRLFSLAAGGAAGITASMLAQAVLLLRDRSVPIAPAFRLSLVLGAVIGFAGTLAFGFALGGAGSHWVGGTATDAGGLPLMGWSRTGGDLRVAHFWATHAFQVLPLAGALISRMRPVLQSTAVWAAAALYGLFVVLTYLQAVAGEPFPAG